MLTSMENDLLEKRAKSQFARDIVVAKSFLTKLGGSISQTDAIKNTKKYDTKLKRLEFVLKPFMQRKNTNGVLAKPGYFQQLSYKYIELYDVYSFMAKFMFGLEATHLKISDLDAPQLLDIYNNYFKADYVNHQFYMYENKDKQILTSKIVKEFSENAVNEI